MYVGIWLLSMKLQNSLYCWKMQRNERGLPLQYQGAIYHLTEILPVLKQLGNNDYQPKNLAWQDSAMLIDGFITTFIPP